MCTRPQLSPESTGLCSLGGKSRQQSGKRQKRQHAILAFFHIVLMRPHPKCLLWAPGTGWISTSHGALAGGNTADRCSSVVSALLCRGAATLSLQSSYNSPTGRHVSEDGGGPLRPWNMLANVNPLSPRRFPPIRQWQGMGGGGTNCTKPKPLQRAGAMQPKLNSPLETPHLNTQKGGLPTATDGS